MQKMDIGILVMGLPFDGNTLTTASLGGSESAGLYMGKELAKLGHRVRMYCNTSDVSRDAEGVEYYPYGMWTQFARTRPHDVTIVQRAPEIFAQQTFSKLNLLWMHDLALGRQVKVLSSVMWNVNKIITVSEWHKKQYMEVTGLPDECFWASRNGIDIQLIQALRADVAEARDPFKLAYSARPERGLDNLLRYTMPKLLEKDKRYHLHIYGYNNQVEHLASFYNECRRLAAALGDRVTWHDPMSKPDLYREYLTCGLYVYPSPSPRNKGFAEVSCITAMEIQACGMPMVTCDKGAMLETLRGGAYISVPGDAWTEEFQTKFVDAILEYRNLYEKGLYGEASSVAANCGARYGWGEVAKQWTSLFEQEIGRNNDNPYRLARHFWRNSDIVALDHLNKVTKWESKGEEDAVDVMLDPFKFAFGTSEDFAAQYARIGDTHNEDGFEWAQKEARFYLLRDWLLAHRDEVNEVLDYGCGLGGYAFGAAKATEISVTGVDVDPKTIEIASRRSKQADPNVPVRFVVGTHDALPKGLTGFDCGLLQEVLEHVPAPWEVLQSVESRVKDGGWMYITVPFGPWEYSSYYTYPWRCHIWHFDEHDIRDMLGNKDGLSIATYHYAESEELGTAMGWWIITYKVDHKPIGKINLGRKLKLQAPKQTVSLTVIAGGQAAEETLLWCLNSVTHLVDEVVLVDCGLTEEAGTLIERYAKNKLFPIHVFSGKDPKTHGFEVARNIGLDNCAMDWVLWLDTDERLINPRMASKYLRENRFHGYGIRQHHFACDTSFEPDMPVRLFRRRPFAGDKAMRFYGAIHEHAELGVNEGPGPVIVLTDVHIAHVGYLIEGTRMGRFARNYPLLKLDEERYPDRLLQKHFLMRDKMILVREALVNANGQANDSIVAVCKEVVELYRKYFLGKRTYQNSDSLQYYSDALAVMGEGFEATFSFTADKDSAQPGSAKRYRFANQEDFLAEVSIRAKEVVSPFVDTQAW